MNNLKPQWKLIRLVILEDKWKSSLTQRSEISISYPSSEKYEIFYRVKRNCSVLCISPERGEKKKKKKNARSDKAIPSGSEIGCWEMTDDPD